MSATAYAALPMAGRSGFNASTSSKRSVRTVFRKASHAVGLSASLLVPAGGVFRPRALRRGHTLQRLAALELASLPADVIVVYGSPATRADNDSNLAFLEDLIIAVPTLGLQLISVPMRTSHDFERVFAAMMQRQPNAFVTTADDLIPRM